MLSRFLPDSGASPTRPGEGESVKSRCLCLKMRGSVHANDVVQNVHLLRDTLLRGGYGEGVGLIISAYMFEGGTMRGRMPMASYERYVRT